MTSPFEGVENGDAAGKAAVSDKWLSLWRSFDFSWHGLANANWKGASDAEASLKRWRAPIDIPCEGQIIGDESRGYRQASLQDYWRWSFGFESIASDDPATLLTDEQLYDAGLLVQRDGLLWHILFRPETKLTDVIVREDEAILLLSRALKTRLRAAGADSGEADRRVQLVGARASQIDLCWRAMSTTRSGAKTRQVFLRAEMANFAEVNASKTEFGDTTSFARASFTGRSNFETAKFGRRVDLGQAVFGPVSDFYRAKFGPDTSFERAVFGQEALFQGASFGANTSFRHVRFGNVANFGQATFDENAGFRGCDLADETIFNSAVIGPGAEFRRTRFGKHVDFGHATLAEATFEEIRVEQTQTINFESADLSRCHLRSVNLKNINTTWSGATLDDAEFAKVGYDPRRLYGRCIGLKGGDSIWGDALLRRAMQDQDYIDTLESRLMSARPVLEGKPHGSEELAAKARRYWANTKAVMAPDAPVRVWLILILSSVLGGTLAAAVMSPTLSTALQGSASLNSGQLGGMALFIFLIGFVVTPLIALLLNSWLGRHAMFKMWALLGFGRDWDRVAMLAVMLIGIFGLIYWGARDTHILFGCDGWELTDECRNPSSGGSHWFMPWFVAAMGFATLGIGDFAKPLTGLGQLIMIANVLSGFTIFGLMLAVLGNRFARRS